MKTLIEKLNKHYKSFQNKVFFIEEYSEQKRIISIGTFTNSVPSTLCKNIAKYIKKQMKNTNEFNYICVGSWVFKPSEI